MHIFCKTKSQSGSQSIFHDYFFLFLLLSSLPLCLHITLGLTLPSIQPVSQSTTFVLLLLYLMNKMIVEPRRIETVAAVVGRIYWIVWGLSKVTGLHATAVAVLFSWLLFPRAFFSELKKMQTRHMPYIYLLAQSIKRDEL